METIEGRNRRIVEEERSRVPEDVQRRFDQLSQMQSQPTPRETKIADIMRNITSSGADSVYQQVADPYIKERSEKEIYQSPIIGPMAQWWTAKKRASEGNPISEQEFKIDPAADKARKALYSGYIDLLKAKNIASGRPTVENLGLATLNKEYFATISTLDKDSLNVLSEYNTSNPETKKSIIAAIKEADILGLSTGDALRRALTASTAPKPVQTKTQTSTQPQPAKQSIDTTTTQPSQQATPVAGVGSDNLVSLLGNRRTEHPVKFAGVSDRYGLPLVESNGKRYVLGSWEHPLAKTFMASMLAQDTNESKSALQNKLIDHILTAKRDMDKASREEIDKDVDRKWKMFEKTREAMWNSKDLSPDELISSFIPYAMAKNKQLQLQGKEPIFEFPDITQYDIVGVYTDPKSGVIYDKYTGAPYLLVKKKGAQESQTPELFSFIKK